ncbi:MAG: hypothetical protein ABR508_08605 [Candidatus Baltobacteraceae bacterium]
MFKRLAPLMFFAVAASCSGGRTTPVPGDTSLAAQTSTWAGVFRYQPAALTLDLLTPGMQFFYVDTVPVNGVQPDAQMFLSEFAAANASVVTGACSGIATLSYALISPNTFSGQQNATVVISAYPRASGDCTQTVNLGLTGAAPFSLHIQ